MVWTVRVHGNFSHSNVYEWMVSQQLWISECNNGRATGKLLLPVERDSLSGGLVIDHPSAFLHITNTYWASLTVPLIELISYVAFY